jgi:hypothetical protein
MVALLSSGHNLSENICRGVLREYMLHDTLIHSSRLSSNMITYGVRPLLQHGLWALRVMDDRHVVPM